MTEVTTSVLLNRITSLLSPPALSTHSGLSTSLSVCLSVKLCLCLETEIYTSRLREIAVSVNSYIHCFVLLLRVSWWVYWCGSQSWWRSKVKGNQSQLTLLITDLCVVLLQYQLWLHIRWRNGNGFQLHCQVLWSEVSVLLTFLLYQSSV